MKRPYQPMLAFGPVPQSAVALRERAKLRVLRDEIAADVAAGRSRKLARDRAAESEAALEARALGVRLR